MKIFAVLILVALASVLFNTDNLKAHDCPPGAYHAEFTETFLDINGNDCDVIIHYCYMCHFDVSGPAGNVYNIYYEIPSGCEITELRQKVFGAVDIHFFENADCDIPECSSLQYLNYTRETSKCYENVGTSWLPCPVNWYCVYTAKICYNTSTNSYTVTGQSYTTDGSGPCYAGCSEVTCP